jgi:predicted dinucleotide-binding enzyme
MDAEIVLLAIPYNAVNEVLPQIKSLLKGKILIDVTNPLSEDYSSLKLGTTTSAAEEIAEMLPGTSVVKAFYTVFAQVYASQNPKIQEKTISVFYVGDDDEAMKKVGGLIKQMGFDAVNCGPLKSARNLEPMALMNITMGYALKNGTSIGFSFLR